MRRATANITLLVGLTLVVALTFPVAGCGDESTGPEPTGRLTIATSTVGLDLDPSGYVVSVDSSSQPIGLNDTVTFDLNPGDYTVELTDVATNCKVTGGSAVGVSLPADSTIEFLFGVNCFRSVAGLWSGMYTVTSCTPVVSVFCIDVFFSGASLILELSLTQAGASVGGDIAQGSLLGTVDGLVDVNGLVSLSGEIGGPADDATSTILSWQTALNADTLSGNWGFRTVDNIDPGVAPATVSATLRLFGSSVLKFFGCPADGDLALGRAISGALTTEDCELADGSFFDVYALTVAAGDSVSIALRSTSFDAFLLIADQNEELVDGDDDSGGGPNGTDALVIRRFQTGGTFLVIANSFQGGETGLYTLAATRLDAAPSAAQAHRGDSATAQKPALQIQNSKLRGSDGASVDPLARKLGTRRWPVERR